MLNLAVGCKRRRKLQLSLIYMTLWTILKERNAILFISVRRAYMLLAEDISIHTFNWIKNRSNCYMFDWSF